MASQYVSYRLVLDAGNAQSASEPAPLREILAAFDAQVATGAFRPDGGRRLLVLSEEEWASRCGLAMRTAAGDVEAARDRP